MAKSTLKKGIIENWLPGLLSNYEITDNSKDATIAVFVNEGDANPIMYGESSPHLKPDEGHAADKLAVALFRSMIMQKKLIVGLGRGAVVLAALSGAKILTQVEGHKEREHNCFLNHSKITYPAKIQSDHNQLIYTGSNYSRDGVTHLIVKKNNGNPFPISRDCTGKVYSFDKFNLSPTTELEGAYFTNSKSLCCIPNPYVNYEVGRSLLDWIEQLLQKDEF